MTQLGILYITLTVAMLLFRKSLARVLAVAGATPIGVVLSLGGEGAPAFYILGCVALIIALAGALRARRPELTQGRRIGKSHLLLFAAWCLLVTAAAPILFSGTPVLAPRGGIDAEVLDPSSLEFTVSNFAQGAYLVLGAGVVFYLSQSRASTPGLLALPLGGFLLISVWRLASMRAGLPFPEGFFDNSEGVRIIERTATGGDRFRGIGSEPSTVGRYSIVAIVYFTWLAKYLAGWRKTGSMALVVVGVILGAASTSTLFVVTAGVVCLAVAATRTMQFVGGGVLKPSVFLGATALVILGIPFLPRLFQIVAGILTDKTDSSSFYARSSSDLFSMGVARDTLLFGAGLGSNRPSSLFAMLLSCVGVIGTALFVLVVVSLVRGAWAHEEYRPVVGALLTLLAAKVIAGPSLSDPLLWISLGVLARAAWSVEPFHVHAESAVRHRKGDTRRRQGVLDAVR